MTLIRNQPNLCYYQKRYHVRVPKRAMSKGWVNTEFVPGGLPCAGGPGPDPDPNVTVDFAFTVGRLSTNYGYDVTSAYGSMVPTPEAFNGVYLRTVRMGASSTSLTIIFSSTTAFTDQVRVPLNETSITVGIFGQEFQANWVPNVYSAYLQGLDTHANYEGQTIPFSITYIKE